MIVVTGGRDFKDEDLVLRVLDGINEKGIYHVGCCPTGVDKIVRENYTHVEYKADWTKHGKAAGPIRNKEMIDHAAKLDGILLAFPGGKGTADCIRQAKAAGIPVIKVEV